MAIKHPRKVMAARAAPSGANDMGEIHRPAFAKPTVGADGRAVTDWLNRGVSVAPWVAGG